MRKYKNVIILESNTTEEEIARDKLFNVFVFSLPRSGSSMMTNIVKALGVDIKSTSEDIGPEKRAEMEAKKYGEGGYRMNPGGFFEITHNAWDHYLSIISTPFSGCKMIIPVTREREAVVTFNPGAKVIMMWRDPEEMRQSQQASYKGDLETTEEEAEHARAIIRTKLATQKLRLDSAGIAALHVQYREVLQRPDSVVREVASFLGVTDEAKIKAAVSIVDPAQNRFKKEHLTENI